MRAFCLLFAAFFASCAPAAAPPALPVASIVVDGAEGPNTFKVEVAANGASQEQGLMFRARLAPDAGMLFDFHRPLQVNFWMKNTILSLDMIFIRQDGTISSIAANTVPFSTDLIPSGDAVRAVLEIRGGRAEELGIVPGDYVHAAIFGNSVPEKMGR